MRKGIKAKTILNSLKNAVSGCEDKKIITASDMSCEDLPNVSKEEAYSERMTHLAALRDMVSNLDSGEAAVVLHVLTEKYPLIAASSIGASLSYKNDIINSIRKETK